MYSPALFHVALEVLAAVNLPSTEASMLKTS